MPRTARAHGFASWPRLQSHVRAIAGRTWNPSAQHDDEPPAHRFVRGVCETWTGTAPDPVAARQLLRSHPEIAGDPTVAAVTGDTAALREHLRTHDPDEACGPIGWSLLMYVAYSRWPVPGSAGRETTASLLDAGADPDDGRHFSGHATPFTVLTGLLGGGENGESPHPHHVDLARMLLDAGAEPTDPQLLYNRMFDVDDTHLRLLFPFGLGTGEGGPWRRRLPDLIAPPEVLVRQHLAWAVVHGMAARVTLLADHGVDVLTALPDGPGPLRGGGTPIAVAARNGHRGLVDLLRTRGAEEPDLDGVEALLGAILAGDRDAVATVEPTVGASARRRHPGFAAWAATRGVEAVAAALDAGFAVDGLGRGDTPVQQPWQTALHTAVERDDADLVGWLLARGADPTIRDARFGGTPLDWSRHLGHPACEGALLSGQEHGG